MRHSLKSSIAALVVIVSLTGCASRSIQYTMTKVDVSQSQFIQDQKLLRDTAGVDQVIPRHDSQNVATIELYLTEGDTEQGLRAATDLGYHLVRN